MKKSELISKLKLMGNITIDQKKKIVCSLIGHSRIITTFFGYVYCGRCGDQIGDSIGGVFDGSKCVIVDHECEICIQNEKNLTWKDRYLSQEPFKNKQP